MKLPSATLTDREVEIIVADLLRAGVLLAAAVVTLGGIILLVRHGRVAPHYSTFVGVPEELRSISGICRRALTFRGRNMIQFGLLILIATPVARVAFSVVAFALQRDRLYMGITLFVLAVLIFSLAGGHV